MAWQQMTLGVLVAMGMWQGSKPTADGPVFLDNVQVPAHVAGGVSVDVTLTGNLPSPAYELVEPGVQRTDHHLIIQLASHLKNKNPTIQVLVPFTQVVKLGALEPGDWTITVKPTRGEPVDTTVTVDQ